MAWELDLRDVPTRKRRFCVGMVCDEIMDAIGIPLALPTIYSKYRATSPLFRSI